jgi:hypothetical protein
MFAGSILGRQFILARDAHARRDRASDARLQEESAPFKRIADRNAMRRVKRKLRRTTTVGRKQAFIADFAKNGGIREQRSRRADAGCPVAGRYISGAALKRLAPTP